MSVVRIQATHTALLHTIQLGTQLFNPHRFYPVLHAIKSGRVLDANSQSVDITNVLTEYFSSAVSCFKQQNAVNIRLVGVEPVISSLKILSAEFPGEQKLRETIFQSLLNFIDSEHRLVQAVIAAEKNGLSNKFFWDKIRNEKLVKIPFSSIHNKIRIVHLVANPAEFIGQGINLANLSLIELAKLVRFAPLCSPVLTDAFEVRIGQLASRATHVAEKVHVLNVLLQIGLNGSPSSVLLDHVRTLTKELGALSPTAAVDSLLLTKQSSEDIIWRLRRDPDWFKHLGPVHVIRALKAVNHDTAEVIVPALRHPIETHDLSPIELEQLISAFSMVAKNPWTQFEGIAAEIFRKVIRCCQEWSDDEITHLVSLLVETVGISDVSLLEKLLADRQEVLATIRPAASGLGQLVFSKTLLGTKRNIDHIMSSIATCNRISFQSRLSDLSVRELLEVAQQVGNKFNETRDTKTLLANLELIGDAVSETEEIGGYIALLNIFATHGFPCKNLVELISKRIDQIDQLDFLEFIRSASLVRCVPTATEKYLLSHDMTVLTATQIASLTESLSSLSVLGQQESVVLLSAFLDCAETMSSTERAKASAKMLSSLFIALIVPEEKCLKQLQTYMEGNNEEIDLFDQAVIAEMSNVLGQFNKGPFPSYQLPGDPITEAIKTRLVGRTRVQAGVTALSDAEAVNGQGVLVAPPSAHYFSEPRQLVAIEKFRLFLLQNSFKRKAKIQNWS